MKLPRPNIHMLLSIEEQKIEKKKEAEEMPHIREGILMGLLIDVADVFNVPLRLIKAGDQQDLTVLVRAIFYYVARMKTEYGLKPMANVAGRKDHAGVIRHVKIINSYFKFKDAEFLSLWNHYLTNSKLFTSKDF